MQGHKKVEEQFIQRSGVNKATRLNIFRGLDKFASLHIVPPYEVVVHWKDLA